MQTARSLSKNLTSLFAFSLRIRLILIVLLIAIPGFGLILYTNFEQQQIVKDALETHASPDLVLMQLNRLFLQNLLGLSGVVILAFAISWIIGNRLIVQQIEGLQEVDKMKDEFVSVASHELRTPMTAIKGLVSMIMDHDFGPVNERLNEPLRDIFNSTERLIHLVNDLLNLSRIEAGRLKFSFTTFSTDKVLKEFIKTFDPIVKEKGIELIVGNTTSTLVRADVDKIGEVLNNLIGNSLKFTDHGGIYISSHDTGEFVQIEVKDTGIGISKEDQEKIFGKFEQIVSQQEGRPQGTGLGLYIARELARGMGGSLWILNSEAGHGSTFAFTLPIATKSSSS